jgi:hypothetical protein
MNHKITLRMKDGTVLTGITKWEWQARTFTKEMAKGGGGFVEVPGTNEHVQPSQVVRFTVEAVKK